MKRALVLPVLLLAVAACDAPLVGGEGAPVGTLVEGSSQAAGTPVAIEFPEGRLDLTVSEPTGDLPAYDETYDHAEDGASFVGVTWDYDFVSALPAMRTPGAEDVAPSVRLVADGREYDLGPALLTQPGDTAYGQSALDFFGTVWVAVDGEPDELAVRLEYDGLDQEVAVEFPAMPDADRGPAQALYRERTSMVAARGACAGPTYPGGNGIVLQSPGCSATAVRVPYQSEVGWVGSRDESWLVVEVTAYPGVGAYRQGSGDPVRLDAAEVPFTVTLDGAEPAAVVGDATSGRLLAVFASEALGNGELQVAADYPTEEGPLVQTRWTVPIT